MRRPTSKKPGKQRKWLSEAPLNKRQKILSSTLSESLRNKYKRRTLTPRKGDKVKVMRGEMKGTVGEIMKVDLVEYTVYLTGVVGKKADGTEVEKPVHASNVMLTDLVLEDKERRVLLEKKVPSK